MFPSNNIQLLLFFLIFLTFIRSQEYLNDSKILEENVTTTSSPNTPRPNGVTKKPLGVCWTGQGRDLECTQPNSTKLMTKRDCCNEKGVGWTRKRFFDIADRDPKCEICPPKCKDVRCEKNEECVETETSTLCVCKRCDEATVDRLCGFDRRTYRSKCHLERQVCLYNTNILINYKGACQNSCDEVQCDEGKVCFPDIEGVPRCLPKQIYPENSTNFFCTSDNETFPIGIYGHDIAYFEKCKANATCDNIPCEQTCLIHGNNGIPVCKDCTSYCEERVAYETRDDHLCASNGKEYNNYCSMKNEACSLGVYSRARHLGPCQKSNITYYIL